MIESEARMRHTQSQRQRKTQSHKETEKIASDPASPIPVTNTKTQRHSPRHRDTETQRYTDTETQRHRDTGLTNSASDHLSPIPVTDTRPHLEVA